METVIWGMKIYILGKVKEFCEKNKISEKNWFKRGIIIKEPSGLEGDVFHLLYKHFFKKYHERITVPYDFEKYSLWGM